MKKYLLLITFVLMATVAAIAQDTTNMTKIPDEESKAGIADKTYYTTGTFKTTRLIDGHTVENIDPGVLDFKILHRFGTIGGKSGGGYNLFGLDNATTRFGFDYGLTNTVMIGIGRSTSFKTYDAFFKWKILRQSSGKKYMPITLSYVPTIGIISFRDTAIYKSFSNRVNYTHQLLIGRKFSEGFSLQIMPTVIHRNSPVDNGPNDVFAIGFGGRQKITGRTSFNAEYYYQIYKYRVPGSTNVLSLGFDIQTGGHVFQLHITNSSSMTESNFITGNKGSWGDGEILFGFNVSRVFNVGKIIKKNSR
ncbi:MAG: hypothetical protein H0W75_01935 [Chitinophagaceae bacterium]|nr:hypothetical protein [Chitinophagaceae bacterium]